MTNFALPKSPVLWSATFRIVGLLDDFCAVMVHRHRDFESSFEQKLVILKAANCIALSATIDYTYEQSYFLTTLLR